MGLRKTHQDASTQHAPSLKRDSVIVLKKSKIIFQLPYDTCDVNDQIRMKYTAFITPTCVSEVNATSVLLIQMLRVTE